jgi:hypothetical protein
MYFIRHRLNEGAQKYCCYHFGLLTWIQLCVGEFRFPIDGCVQIGLSFSYIYMKVTNRIVLELLSCAAATSFLGKTEHP